MAKAETIYARAPITEAALSIGVAPAADVTVESLTVMTERLRGEYPQVETVYDAMGQLSVGEPLGSTISQVKAGFYARSATGARVYVSRLDGLIVSKLAPYDRWADLRAHAQRIWADYCSVVRPEKISRLGLRFINRINIPRPASGLGIDLEHYLKTGIDISPDLPPATTEMANFFYQVQMPQQDIGALCIITGAGLPSASPDVISVLLDIDVSRSTDVPQSDEDLWASFDQLRARKNLIFEACITDQARELFR